MTLRLTGLSSYYMFSRSLAQRNFDMFRTSEQVSTNKRINRPSDDPEGAKMLLSLKGNMSQIDQYDSNLDVADRNLRQVESSLSSVKDLLVRAKEIAIAGKNGTLGTDARRGLAEEVQQLQQQLLSLSNTQVGGEYIFGGFKTTTQPFSLDASQPNADPVVTYAGDSNIRSIQISDDSTIAIQVRADLVFRGDGGASTTDLFQALADLEVALRTNNVDDTDPASVGQQIDELDLGITQVLNEVTSVGAKSNRILTAKESIASQRETLRLFISEIEDADMGQVATEFQRANMALNATIQSAGTILNMPSLMSFLGK